MSSSAYGFATPDVSQVALAFKSDIEEVVEVLYSIGEFASLHKDANLLSSILYKDNELFILDLSEYDWIVVIPRLYNSPVACLLNEKGETLSKNTDCNVVSFFTTDTGDFSCFWHYKSGKILDKLEKVYERVRGYEDRELTSDLMNDLLENEPDFVVDSYFHYINSYERVDEIRSIDQADWSNNSFTLTNQFMYREKIYLPSLGDLDLTNVDWLALQLQAS